MTKTETIIDGLDKLAKINQEHKDIMYKVKMELSPYLYDEVSDEVTEEFFASHVDVFEKLDNIEEFIKEAEKFHIKVDKWLK